MVRNKLEIMVVLEIKVRDENCEKIKRTILVIGTI